MVSNHAEGAAEHLDCLTDIIPEPHPVEQPGEGVEHPLKPLRVSGRDHDVIRVEEVRAVKNPPPPPVCTSCSSLHQRYPVDHHCIQNNGEMVGENGSP